MVRMMMSLHEKGTAYSDEFPIKVGVRNQFVLSTIVKAITEKIAKGLFHDILYDDNLILMSNFIEDIQRKFANWKTIENQIYDEELQRRATNQ